MLQCCRYKRCRSFLDALAPRELLKPARRNAAQPQQRAGDLASNGGDGVGVATKICSQDDGIAEAFRAVNSPERGVERFNDVATGPDLVALLLSPRALCHRRETGRLRRPRAQSEFLITRTNGVDKNLREERRRFDGLQRRMR